MAGINPPVFSKSMVTFSIKTPKNLTAEIAEHTENKKKNNRSTI
jgi:metal-responsive CopG/Arc/MetJ family transcriptional regulator